MIKLNVNAGDTIFFAGAFYEVAEIKTSILGDMVGIYDEPPTKHIDYLNPDSVRIAYPCHTCQGGGCPTCGGYGKIVS